MSESPLALARTGRLSGEWAGGVAVFRGVPFAAAPVGPARWRPPGRPEGWEGTRPATCFGPAPVQPLPRRSSIMYQANFADRRALVMSEDCLYLNVWTADPSPGAGLPVMVWLHGGGNRFGYGSQDIHDGANLAGRGIVVVTLNYRLGALGFLAHPDLSRATPGGTSGNWALLDVIAALEWVRDNITAFGGDPGRVTLAGNSAGAAIACHLMTSPPASALFARVIGQSSAGLNRPEGQMRTLQQAEADGVAFAGRGGLAELRDRSAVELAAAPGHFGPVMDGKVLVRDTQESFGQGAQAPVPLLAGSNTGEGSVYTTVTAAAELTELAAGLAPDSGFHGAYPVGDPVLARRSARLYTGETRFVWPVWRWAAEHARTSPAPVWLYRFDREPPLPPAPWLAAPPDGDPGYGAFHSAELPYVWDNLGQHPWPWTAADHELAAAMSAAWVRFMRTGDPNGGTLPPWREFTEKDPQVMRFGPVTGAAAEASAGVVTRAGSMDRLDAMRALDDMRAR